MKPNPLYLNQPKHFWANVRAISQKAGYTHAGQIRVPSLLEMQSALHKMDLSSAHILEWDRRPTKFGEMLLRHYLMVDAHFTWWVKGRSYLCRILDMLHMGYVDEALFGREVLERMPKIVNEWVELAKGLRAQRP